MNRCQSFESVIHGKDAMDVLVRAPPVSKNIAQGLAWGRRIIHQKGRQILLQQLSPVAVQRIWGTSCNQPHSRVPVCDRHLSTSLYRGHGASLASGPSLTPASLRGTHCRVISAKQSISLVLGSCKDASIYFRLRRLPIFTPVLSPVLHLLLH